MEEQSRRPYAYVPPPSVLPPPPPSMIQSPTELYERKRQDSFSIEPANIKPINPSRLATIPPPPPSFSHNLSNSPPPISQSVQSPPQSGNAQVLPPAPVQSNYDLETDSSEDSEADEDMNSKKEESPPPSNNRWLKSMEKIVEEMEKMNFFKEPEIHHS